MGAHTQKFRHFPKNSVVSWVRIPKNFDIFPRIPWCHGCAYPKISTFSQEFRGVMGAHTQKFRHFPKNSEVSWVRIPKNFDIFPRIPRCHGCAYPKISTFSQEFRGVM